MGVHLISNSRFEPFRDFEVLPRHFSTLLNLDYKYYKAGSIKKYEFSMINPTVIYTKIILSLFIQRSYRA